MAFTTTVSKIIFTGDDSSVAFSYPYLFYVNGDLKVYLKDTTSEDDPVEKTEITHYTVTGAEDPDGGTVTMVTAPTATEELIIDREVDETQGSTYVNYNRFPATTVEKNLNILTMMVQKHTEELGRAFLKPIDETTTTTIPSPTTDRCLKWDSGGNLVNSTYDPDAQQDALADCLAAQTAAETAQTGAETAETGAETAETNAGTSATAAAASAAAAAAALGVGVNDVSWATTSVSTAVIDSGSVFVGVDSGQIFTFAENRTFDIAGTAGTLGSLNTGSEASGTEYFLIGLGDTTATVAPHVIGVTAANYASFTTADLTGNYSDYDDYKRIGVLYNDGSSNFYEGEYVEGIFVYFEDVAESTTSTTFVDITLGQLPSVTRKAHILFRGNGAAAAKWRPDGSSSGDGKFIFNGVTQVVTHLITVNSSQTFEWKTSAGTLWGTVSSYYDNLSTEGQ